MIAKIKRGGGFRGALDYALNEGKKAVEGKDAELIGGNMSGTNSRDLAEEFKASRELRPEVSRPVWTESLRPAEGDTLTDEQWLEVAHSHMQQIGLDPDKHMHVIVKHHDHIHIVASRIAVDASLYHGKNENLIASRDCRRIEREYGLTRVKPDMAKSKSLTKNEVEMSKRTNAEPPRERIQRVVSEAAKTAPDMDSFKKALAAEGVEYRRSGLGVSYATDGVAFKASQLGTDFKAKAIEKRVEQNRPEPVKPTPEPAKHQFNFAGAAERAAERQAKLDEAKAMFAPKPEVKPPAQPTPTPEPEKPVQEAVRPIERPVFEPVKPKPEPLPPVDQVQQIIKHRTPEEIRADIDRIEQRYAVTAEDRAAHKAAYLAPIQSERAKLRPKISDYNAELTKWKELGHERGWTPGKPPLAFGRAEFKAWEAAGAKLEERAQALKVEKDGLDKRLEAAERNYSHAPQWDRHGGEECDLWKLPAQKAQAQSPEYRELKAEWEASVKHKIAEEIAREKEKAPEKSRGREIEHDGPGM